MMYHNGEGVEQDYQKSLEYFYYLLIKKTKSMYNLGNLSIWNRVKKNSLEAI